MAKKKKFEVKILYGEYVCLECEYAWKFLWEKDRPEPLWMKKCPRCFGLGLFPYKKERKDDGKPE